MKNANDLTRGGVASTLLRFSVPYLLASLLQTLYGIVDLIVVGQFTDGVGLAAVSAGGLIMATFNCALIGLVVGGTVLVGQLLGAKKEKDVLETISTCFCLYPISGLVLTVVLSFLARPLLLLMNTPEESFADALVYLQICIGGLIFTAGYNALASVLRGMGDSKSPLLFVVIACIFNILGDLLLVAVFHLGAAGAAIATTAAQALSVILGIVYLKRRDFVFDFKPRSFRINGDKAKTLLRLGLPTCAQETLVMISFIFIEALINGLGYIAVAAAGIADKIFMIASVSSIAFSSSIAAMVAQNVGAGEDARAKKSMRVGTELSLAAAAVFFLIMLFWSPQVFRIFTADEEVIADACRYTVFYKFEYLVCAVTFCIGGFINGTGHTRLTLVNGIVSAFVVRIPLVWYMSSLPGATLLQLGVALPIASAAQLAINLGYYLSGKWKKRVTM